MRMLRPDFIGDFWQQGDEYLQFRAVACVPQSALHWRGADSSGE
jgi:hypothetical protein